MGTCVPPRPPATPTTSNSRSPCQSRFDNSNNRNSCELVVKNNQVNDDDESGEYMQLNSQDTTSEALRSDKRQRRLPCYKWCTSPSVGHFLAFFWDCRNMLPFSNTRFREREERLIWVSSHPHLPSCCSLPHSGLIHWLCPLFISPTIGTVMYDQSGGRFDRADVIFWPAVLTQLMALSPHFYASIKSGQN